MASTGPGKHRHLDSRGKWTTDKDPDHVHDVPSHPADILTADQVSKLILIAAGQGGGTPVPDPNPPPAGDVTAPVISGVSVSVTQTTAQVSWNLDEGGTGQVEYGTTTSYGSASTLETGYLTSHSQTLSGLTAGTTYHYRIRSADAAGNLRVDGDRTFTTTAVTPPPNPTANPFSFTTA